MEILHTPNTKHPHVLRMFILPLYAPSLYGGRESSVLASVCERVR